MSGWMIDLYLLLTARVPRPASAMLFGVVTLTVYTLLTPYGPSAAQAGLLLPVLAILAGFVVVILRNMPVTIENLRGIDAGRAVWLTVLFPLALCSVGVFAPSLGWAQHALSIVSGIYLGIFVVITRNADGLREMRWFGRSWRSGLRNAANWNVARLVALILGNEAVARSGTPTDWVVAVSLGPIALHYLMFWTILATHPYEPEGADDDRP